MEHHDVISSGIIVYKFRDKGPQERMKLSLETFEVATESYMVEVILEFSF